MQISQKQAQAIHAVVAEALGEQASTWLFGSRVDDNALGGDIDLLVISPTPVDNSLKITASIATKVMRLFHGRKTDVIIQAPNLKSSPIHQVALQTGIKLWRNRG